DRPVGRGGPVRGRNPGRVLPPRAAPGDPGERVPPTRRLPRDSGRRELRRGPPLGGGGGRGRGAVRPQRTAVGPAGVRAPLALPSPVSLPLRDRKAAAPGGVPDRRRRGRGRGRYHLAGTRLVARRADPQVGDTAPPVGRVPLPLSLPGRHGPRRPVV